MIIVRRFKIGFFTALMLVWPVVAFVGWLVTCFAA